MDEKTNGTRLPPPAFPPGARRHGSAPDAAREPDPEPESASVDDAMISPDEPLPERSESAPPHFDPMADAFISPDEPLPERRIDLAEGFRDTDAIEPGEEGVVVGMDLDEELEDAEVVAGGDPHVIELIEAIGTLADALRRRGEAGLRATPEMSRFEATLRGYCVGYLAGRRAVEPPPPIMEEPLPTDG